jgi:hypothetical protein
MKNFRLEILKYPKGENKNYEVDFDEMDKQLNLFG